MKHHLETSAVFKGVSKTIQNEILDCLLQIYHEEIRTEIRKASFVAVMADDTTDVSEHTQIVLVLRYVLNGEIFERFWGFFIPENQNCRRHIKTYFRTIGHNPSRKWTKTDSSDI